MPYEIRGEAGPELVVPLTAAHRRITSPLCATPAPVGEEPAMAKIGTAHVEIKPVLNEEALDALVARIESAIEAGVTRALEKARPIFGDVHVAADHYLKFVEVEQERARRAGLAGEERGDR